MGDIAEESFLMRIFRRFGLYSIAWSLRRIHCPVAKDALVLEVGSGGNPYARANVLLDAYESTRERHWVPLVVDRPMVLGFVERLPFKDNSFDFVIASHVLEHSSDPDRFLSELQRVAKAGYIEVPDAFMERINPYRDHRLEITIRDNELVIRKKKTWQVDPETVELYEDRVKPILTGELIPAHPFDFHVRYYWNDKIAYKVLNPEVDASWKPDETVKQQILHAPTLIGNLKGVLVNEFRSFLSQSRRNQTIDLMELLACPDCGSGDLKREGGAIICSGCGESFSERNGIPIMYAASQNVNG